MFLYRLWEGRVAGGPIGASIPPHTARDPRHKPFLGPMGTLFGAPARATTRVHTYRLRCAAHFLQLPEVSELTEDFLPHPSGYLTPTRLHHTTAARTDPHKRPAPLRAVTILHTSIPSPVRPPPRSHVHACMQAGMHSMDGMHVPVRVLGFQPPLLVVLCC